jgi:hypothetical protein
MTLNKKIYFRKKSNNVYTLIFILFQSHKTRNKYFFISSKKIKTIYEKQVATMQPLSTFPSKGSESIFNCKKISRKVTYVKLIFICRIYGISLMLN